MPPSNKYRFPFTSTTPLPKYSACAFPWVLTPLGLDPAAFQKVVEVVVRAETGLSAAFIKHLSQCESQCLAELVWRPTSSVGKAAMATDPAVAGVLPGAQNIDIRVTLASEMKATMVPKAPHDERAAAAHMQPLFRRKLMHLAHMRLVELGRRCNVPKPLVDLASSIVAHGLNFYASHLLLDLHLDFLLLAGLYAAMKLRPGLSPTFRDIVKAQRQAGAGTLSPKVTVPALLSYYNDRFLNVMEGEL